VAFPPIHLLHGHLDQYFFTPQGKPCMLGWVALLPLSTACVPFCQSRGDACKMQSMIFVVY
jgi:hypothetical protein